MSDRWLPPLLAAAGVVLVTVSVAWIVAAVHSEELACRAASGFWVSSSAGGSCIEPEGK